MSEPRTESHDDHARVVATILKCGFRGGAEFDLHNAVAYALTFANIFHVLEYELSKRDRVDFFLPSMGLAIECKVDGGTAEVVRQLDRYASHDVVRALLLVTTRMRHGVQIPSTLRDKTVTTVVLHGLP